MATVLVPWRGGCQSRDDAFAWVRLQYERAHPDWRLIRCQAPVGPWVKALAVMPVIAECSDGVLVIADADVWCEGLAEAVSDVQEGAAWAIPHGGVFRLSEQATAEVFAGGELREDAELTRPAYKGTEGGGFVIARRDTLLDIPLDPRFVGWGNEDDSWGIALRCLAGAPKRGRRPPLFHLWHPPQDRLTTRWGSAESKRLYKRYHAAREAPDAMRTLIEEGRSV